MSDLTDRIAEAIRESAWTGCDPTRISNARTLSEAVAAVVHPEIRTVEELDALPVGSVAIETRTGHAWVRHSEKWHCTCRVGTDVEWTSQEIAEDHGIAGTRVLFTPGGDS